MNSILGYTIEYSNARYLDDITHVKTKLNLLEIDVRK